MNYGVDLADAFAIMNSCALLPERRAAYRPTASRGNLLTAHAHRAFSRRVFFHRHNDKGRVMIVRCLE